MADTIDYTVENEKKTHEDEYTKNPEHLRAVPDMSSLIYLEGSNVLDNLGFRYAKDEIYTSISKVLLAVNPYKNIDIYTGTLISSYRAAASKRTRQKLPPHVFSVSQVALRNLQKYKLNQSLIVCGESGSGKTESAKHLMRYLAYVPEGTIAAAAAATTTAQKASIERQVLDANPILESFGNAKTVLNNNSSRFGKFTKIVFGPQQEKIKGAFIETYLLEKSRVVNQDNQERNYHIFYQLCAKGALDANTYKEWGLRDASTFHYLGQSGCTTVQGHDDVKWFHKLLPAMTILGFDEAGRDDVLKLVAGVLHLGDVQLVEGTGGTKDAAQVADTTEAKNALSYASKLFQVDTKELAKRVVTRELNVRNQIILKTLSLHDAIENRDSMAKALYNSVFNYVVRKLNDALFDVSARSPDLLWIGILDVFGFESFEHNSFEQFCINFANERLQQYFNVHILKSEQDEYIQEAIFWTPLTVPDNQDVIDLVDKKSSGIFAILDSACRMPKGDASVFVRNLFSMHRYHKRMKQIKRVRYAGSKEYTPIEGFSIRHYAGRVVYTAKAFLKKNAGSTQEGTIKLFSSSKSPFIGKVLRESETFMDSKADKGAHGRKAKTAFKSVGNVFSSQLDQLMKLLHQTTPFFVRCLKPNTEQVPSKFERGYILPQLECGGIIEALRILKCGFPTRCEYDAIFARYGKILKPTPPNLNKRDFCEAILRNVGETLDREEFQLGLSKVFFRPGKQEFLENILASGADLPPQTVMKIRAFLLNKRFQRARGVIRVHVLFHRRLAQKRAAVRVWKAMRVTRVIAVTFFRSLRKIRMRHATATIQACIRTHLLQQAFNAQSAAAKVIGGFIAHNKRRLALNAVLHVRIEKKRKAMKKKERARLIAAEKARTEELKKEAAEREKRRQQEKAEAAQRAKQEQERLAKEAQERELARLEEERLLEEARLRKEHEAAEKARRLEEEYQDKLDHMAAEKEEMEAELELMRAEAEQRLEEEKEALRSEMKLKELEFEERFRSLNESERRSTLMAAESARGGEVGSGVDLMSKLVCKGASMLRHVPKDDSQHAGSGYAVVLIVGQDGVLSYHPETADSDAAPGEEDGSNGASVALSEIAKIEPGDNGALADKKVSGENKAEEQDVESELSGLVFRVEVGILGGGGILYFAAKSMSVRDQWVTALRYAARNMRDLGTVSRPPGDPARGNMLAAQLQDRVDELEAEREILLAGGSCGDDAAAKVGEGSTDKTVMALKAQIMRLQKQNAGLQNMLESGETVNAASIMAAAGGDAASKNDIVRKVRNARKSVINAGTVVLFQEKMKLKQLQQKFRELRVTNMELQAQNDELTDELELLRQGQANRGSLSSTVESGHMGATAMARKRAGSDALLVKQIARKVHKARQQVETAESEVVEAEAEVRKRQEIIRKAMKVLAEHKTALKKTKASLNMLGLENIENPTDETSKRLTRLYKDQQSSYQEAEALLLREYAAMVAVAESLNEKNESLAEKVYARNQHEKVEKAILKQVRGGGRGSGGGGGGSAKPISKARSALAGMRRKAGASSDPNKKDDGCVIS